MNMSWWRSEAPHWKGRTAVLATTLTAIFVLVATMVWGNSGDGSSRPESSITGPAQPYAGGGHGLCSPDSEQEVADGWGPDRPTYTDDTFPSSLTFNSTRSNPNIGDERGFVGVRSLDDAKSDLVNSIEVRPGSTYIVRAFVRLDGPGQLQAHGVTLKFNLPTCTAHRIGTVAQISSSDAFPGEVWDGASFWAHEDFNLAVVPDSVVLYNNAHPDPGLHLANTLFDSRGVQLGYRRMDGELSPGYRYSAYVTFEVRPQFAP